MTEAPLVAGKQILIVDDDLHTRTLLTELCESCGYRVSGAADGDSAIEIADQVQPDLMLLDLILPPKDGFEVLKQMRRRPKTKDIPVVIVSAIDDMDGKIRAMELGADDFLTKPFKLFELQARIHSALLVREYRRRLVAAELELAQYRASDPLTGVGTYAHLKASLDSELARSRRYARPAAILLFGFDFSENRTQPAMDAMDNFVAAAIDDIRTALRAADRVFRLDSDQFVVVLPETDATGAITAGVRMREVVGRLNLEGQPIGLKLGRAVFPNEAIDTSEDLLREAMHNYREAERAA